MDYDEGVLLPIHQHPMVPLRNDTRIGGCCGGHEFIGDGFYCKSCDFFAHKKCSEFSLLLEHPSHPNHALTLCSRLRARSQPFCSILRPRYHYCDLCGKDIADLCYACVTCLFFVDLHCASYPPPEVIGVSETHPPKLTLVKERNQFDCAAKCGKTGAELPYYCHEGDLAFHVDCLSYPLEVNHSCHSLHPLKLLTGRPGEYSDGRCHLCRKKIDDNIFYHCFSCNFSLDMCCVSTPPPLSLLDLKAHDHQLFLLPRLDSFTCNTCGLKGDRSPYICVQCGFMSHQGCLTLPRVININRHDHRISRTSLLGVVNSSVCGVCRQKVDWTCGGYSCQRCPGYVVHSKCATRRDVWNGIELEDVPDETEDTEPYMVIDDNTIQHFSHKEHHLRLNANGLLCEENKHCKACAHPIGLQSLYGCIMDCDFVIHQIYAMEKRQVVNIGVTFVRKKRIQRHGSTRVKITGLACLRSVCSETLQGSCQEAQ